MLTQYKKMALIGSGNVLFKDEGIGLYAVKFLKENFSFQPEINIIDGGTLGFKLMPLLQEFDEVIIANTASEESKNAGDIFVKSADEFLDGGLVKKTANEVEIAEMLQICSMSGKMAKTTIISIVPDDILSVEVGLSDAVQSHWQLYISTILNKVKEAGITVKEKDKNCSLEEILDIFANPSIENNRSF